MVPPLAASKARRLPGAVPGDVVRRQQAIEAEPGEIGRQVLTNKQRRQLLRPSTRSPPSTNMNPWANAARRELGIAHATRRAVHARGTRANHVRSRLRARACFCRELAKRSRPRTRATLRRRREGTRRHRRGRGRGRRATAKDLAIGAGRQVVLVIGEVRPPLGRRRGGGGSGQHGGRRRRSGSRRGAAGCRHRRWRQGWERGDLPTSWLAHVQCTPPITT
jgi:hypothetical protein